MKRYIKTSIDNPDLTTAIKTGLEAVNALREVYPDIPVKKPKYTRRKSWSDYWYVIFDLGINVKEQANDYMNENDPGNYNLYWNYILDFRRTANEIVSQFDSPVVEVHVSHSDETETERNNTFRGHATLIVYALDQPTGRP